MDKELIDNKTLEIREYKIEEEISLIELVKMIYKNRKTIIIITAIITILGVIFALLAPKKYRSDMTFVEQSTSNSSSSLLSSISSSIPFGLGSGLSGGSSSLIPVLESREFKDKISKKLYLREYIIDNEKMDKKMKEEFNQRDIEKWIDKAVIISQDEKTSVYKVEVELEDKVMARKIANEYYYVLDNYLKNEKLDKTKISRQYLEKQVTSIEKELNEKQELLKAYEEEYKSVDIDTDAKAVAENVAKVKGDILSTQTELKVAKSIYGEENEDVIKLEAKLTELNEQLVNLEKGTGSIKFIPLNDIPKIKYEVGKIQQEIEATSEVYKMMKVQLEQAKISEIDKQSVIELIDEAVIPKKPSSTSKKIIVVISGILGIFLGISTVFIKEFSKKIDWKEFKN